ncbi:MAG: S41 family peptidase [Desulfomonile tiedjei]|nr:S41 family peptidase [Desulfomonile tiedjei]
MVRNRAVKATLLVAILLGLLLVSVPVLRCESGSKSSEFDELRLLRRVMGLVHNNYVKEVTDKDLVHGAINGMLQALDPHSTFLTEDMFKELQVETRGEFGGLGIEITLDGGVLTIVSPIEDTPAYRAGLKAGDKIIKINGEATKNITLLKAVKLMRGPQGTKVTITIMREGFKKFKDFTLTRAVIHVHSVKKQVIEPGYPYIRIVNFQESTDSDLTSAIKEMGGDEKIKGAIVDLRNNPGGLLDQAVKVSNLFVDKGLLIVYTDGRAKDQKMEFRSTNTGKHYKFKVAVLINEGSASASEIVAGALQDHDRGLIFGVKSFGKASVQTIIPMENGTGLRLTTAYYYTPYGRHIQKTGIVPDVEVKDDLEKKREEGQEDDSKIKDKDQQKKPQFPRPVVDLEKDKVVQKALEWLKSDVTVKQFKDEQKKKVLPNTARAR